MRVRRAVLSDLHGLRMFRDESEFAPRWTEDDWRQSIERDGSLTFVAEDEASGVCAVVVAHWVLAEVMLENLVVTAGMQRQGIARRLMEALVSEAKALGASELLLEVNERNVAAFRFYEALGFAVQGRRKRYYGGVDDAILMGADVRDLAGR